MGTITKRLTARNLDGLVAELQIRNAVLNGYAALRIRVTEAVGWVCPAKGILGSNAIVAI